MVSTSCLPQTQLLHTSLQAPLIDNGMQDHNLGITQMQIPPLRRDAPIQDARVPKAISADIQTDGVVPSLEAIRRMLTTSNAVSNLLVPYEDQAKASVQGRQPGKSGRNNSTGMAHTAPEFWWSNEGFHGQTGKKKLTYDDLTLPQWVTGQLTNIYHIKDQTTARQALLQVTLAMKDATSLPWTTVRNAWAISMHDLEEGHLGLDNLTQWAINRLKRISNINGQLRNDPSYTPQENL